MMQKLVIGTITNILSTLYYNKDSNSEAREAPQTEVVKADAFSISVRT
jgi:hypothetical protein